jgi:hypothetical protein
MIKKILLFIPLALSVGAFQAQALTLPIPNMDFIKQQSNAKTVLAHREMPLTDRYPQAFVNEVFADNILLTLSYLSHNVSNPAQINWDAVRKPQVHTILLQPGDVFAFHDAELSEFAGSTVATTNAHFNGEEGFKSSGYLFGDGVCHLASLFNWAARDAGLKVVAPVNHDFAHIADIPREYGTAIYYDPNAKAASAQQNLYIQNTKDKPVMIVIYSQRDKVVVSVEEEK